MLWFSSTRDVAVALNDRKDIYRETPTNIAPYFSASNPPVKTNETVHERQAQEVNRRTSPMNTTVLGGPRERLCLRATEGNGDEDGQKFACFHVGFLLRTKRGERHLVPPCIPVV
ncbi:hypothetical protein K443DRAFT_207097 [Laccaria amethystina LaAM-08-1]|uniref:Unplaced genomic scaffold K443scaffold_132, whole genome shotgun sequence n=1 Tax=Laccaria amethystina LaAM-08-1 TaxID=1095629 RepID=A0A0C9XLY7_9AGAR|nr:hypothetical protein K443DRAFT_207097 [Laccaria amethystina LaAM-08-1]